MNEPAISTSEELSEAEEATDSPDWAIRFAQTGLRIGSQPLEIEQTLARKGVTPAAANAAVVHAIGLRYRAAQDELDAADFRRKFARLSSSLVAIGYLILAQSFGLRDIVLGRLILGLTSSLALIWFPDALGSVLGRRIRTDSTQIVFPPKLVSIIGWISLLFAPSLCFWAYMH